MRLPAISCDSRPPSPPLFVFDFLQGWGVSPVFAAKSVKSDGLHGFPFVASIAFFHSEFFGAPHGCGESNDDVQGHSGGQVDAWQQSYRSKWRRNSDATGTNIWCLTPIRRQFVQFNSSRRNSSPRESFFEPLFIAILRLFGGQNPFAYLVLNQIWIVFQ